MYNVNVGPRTQNVPSYEKAVAAAKFTGIALADSLDAQANAVLSSRIYRSPQARARVADGLRRQSANVRKGITIGKFPRKSGDVSLSFGSIPVSIVRA